jgi:hypothetical protein
MTMLRWLCAPLLVSCLAACGGPFFGCGAGPDPCITGNEPSCGRPDIELFPDLSSPDLGPLPDGATPDGATPDGATPDGFTE